MDGESINARVLIPGSNTKIVTTNSVGGNRTCRYFINTFDSLEEFYGYNESHQTSGKTSHKIGNKWYGTNTFEEAIDLARRKGDLESLKLLNYDDDLELRNFAKGLSLEGFDTKLDVSGSYVDINAYLQGQPECMAEFTESYIPKFCDILVNISASCHVEQEEIRKRGLTLFRLVDALERARIKTRIIIYSLTSSYYNDNDCDIQYLSVVAKDYNQILNKEQLSFALCNASFLRRYCFNFQENLDKECKEMLNSSKTPESDKQLIHTLRGIIDISNGYGKPNIIKNIPQGLWRPNRNTHVFLLDTVNVRDFDKLERAVKNLIKKEKENGSEKR